MTVDPRCGLRRFRRAMVIATVATAIPYVWVLWDLWMPSINPLQSGAPDPLSRSAYDAQARAMMAGHFTLANGSIGTEAFVHDGHQYTYFGIFPSLLRMPIFLVTHALDGRLTAVSMLCAWLVCALFASLLLWRIRTVMRGDAPLGWAETTSYGLLLASVLAGSVFLYLASQPNQYSEDLVWSVALASGSLFALLGVVERPSWGRVVACGTLVLLTNLNRATTGYACVIAALLIAAWFGLGRAGQDRRRWWAPMLLVGLVPMVAGVAIDLAKFGIPFGVPVSAQLLFKSGGFIHINGGHYYSPRFIPARSRPMSTQPICGSPRCSPTSPCRTSPAIRSPTQGSSPGLRRPAWWPRPRCWWWPASGAPSSPSCPTETRWSVPSGSF